MVHAYSLVWDGHLCVMASNPLYCLQAALTFDQLTLRDECMAFIEKNTHVSVCLHMEAQSHAHTPSNYVAVVSISCARYCSK